MTVFKQTLSKKERQNILIQLSEIVDLYSDFYITKDNIRLHIKENPEVLLKSLKKGNKIAYNDKGIAVVTGYDDGFNRKYIRVLSESRESIDDLIKIIIWNLKNINLYMKVNKKNKLLIEEKKVEHRGKTKTFYYPKKPLKNNNFKFAGYRGNEVLFCRRSYKK